jgi:hypothetical protein
MACEEADLYYRWQLLEQIAKGEMPPGMTEDDLRAMELPEPGEIELIEKPDGSQVIRRVEAAAATTAPAAKADGDKPSVKASAKAKSAAKAKAKKAVSKSKATASANAFVCDTPDDV